MPTNVEIKARVHDFDDLRNRAERISETPARVITQDDKFFNVPLGRLKLRQLSPDSGQLIYYRRDDSKGPKVSDYLIYETSDPHSLAAVLSQAMGLRGRVRKMRLLYMVGQTRVHLDDVEGLGKFVELEVVLSPDQTASDAEAVARRLMKDLGIRQVDLLAGAYIDLLDASSALPRPSEE